MKLVSIMDEWVLVDTYLTPPPLFDAWKGGEMGRSLPWPWFHLILLLSHCYSLKRPFKSIPLELVYWDWDSTFFHHPFDIRRSVRPFI